MNEETSPELAAKLAEPARDSVRSFWVACAGLAMLAHVPALGISTFVSSYKGWIVDALLETMQFSQDYWRATEVVTYLAGTALTPSVVVACVVPILYWRGHLVQRFSISVVIAITVLNVAGSVNFYPRRMTANWVELAMIVACWVSLPVLFTWTPLKTRHLRLIVASGVMLLTLCLSIMHMYEAQQNAFFLGWMSLYAAAFSFALLRRNWGRVAMVEADTRAEDIQTTSTRTLFELIAVSGLACSAASFWSTQLDMNAAILFAGASAFGLLIAIISMSVIRFAFEPVTYRIPKLLMIWFTAALLFCANGVLITILDLSRYGAGFVKTQSILAIFNVLVVGSTVSSFAYLLLTLAIGNWLRWCGWRIERAPAAMTGAVPSFSELD